MFALIMYFPSGDTVETIKAMVVLQPALIVAGFGDYFRKKIDPAFRASSTPAGKKATVGIVVFMLLFITWGLLWVGLIFPAMNL